jgi:LacI family transcriptional regulator
MRARATIAMILPVGLEYAHRLAEGAVAYLTEYPSLRVIETPYRIGSTCPIGNASASIDGALLWADRRDTWAPRLIERGVKVINCSADWPEDVIPRVCFAPDQYRDAFDHLASLRREHLVFIDHKGKPPHKREAFSRHVRAHSLTAHEFILAGAEASEDRLRLTEPRQERALTRFLRKLPKPAALWCHDDYAGVLVCQTAKRIGLIVPDDLAVLGIGDYLIGGVANPTLSSIPQPGRQVGYEAMRLLDKMLADGSQVRGSCYLPNPSIIQRESTGILSERDNDIEKGHRLIHERATEGITVNEVMETLTISRVTFTKRFAQVYGRTPGAEIRRVRAERAKQYLSNTDITVTRIAGMCGFSDLNLLCIFFKREVGCTPSEFRQQHRS